MAAAEFDERCSHRLADGGGDLLETRRRAFPPAAFCEFEGGQVTAGATGWGAVALWAVLAGAAPSAATGLPAAFLGPPPDTENARGIRIRRGLLLLLISGATLATAYAPAADPMPGALVAVLALPVVLCAVGLVLALCARRRSVRRSP
ncbi:hypothetical protein RM780_15355 [Streptomyces sp. DSM 44917]|uniref:Uncharacterized protein n=1 Tax=Streptomyces boetiae TaxID=3075541 RepID=A0ABU2L9T1_9ACTN|nr:hypothetical protein [Streptomyces sp. DSM 44917]MDT0308329.1 hypothetical protein [Streptomyces sp. DSM 44917]